MSEEYPATLLFLMRHGQARAGDGSYGPDTPLNERGRAQAEKIADAWRGKVPPDVVYTSPYPRAVETSAPLCRRLGLDAVIDPRLLGIPPTSLWQHEFDLGNASITEAHYWPRGRVRGGAPRYAFLRRVGDTTHLGDLTSGL